MAKYLIQPTAHNQVIIFGGSNESINAAILMASLELEVTLVCEQQVVDEVLSQYRFDRQMVSLWDLYSREDKIKLANLISLNINKNNPVQPTFWFFIDAIDKDIESQILPLITNNADTHFILSGVGEIGKAQSISNQIISEFVFYLPFTFMKDGFSFISLLTPDVIFLGEKQPNTYTKSEILNWFIRQAHKYYIADIKTIEFSRNTIMTMLATRLSFMNELSRLADAMQVNIGKVRDIIALDSRIGDSYLNASWGFGGKTLPLELSLLIEQFNTYKVNSQIAEATLSINEDQKELIFRKFWQHFDGFIENKTVVIWGAGYRNGTGRTTNSAIHPLLKLLWSYQIKTLIYANNTAFELEQMYQEQPLFELIEDAYQFLNQADSLLIINWSAINYPDLDKINDAAIPIFDAKNVIENNDIPKLVADYYGIGRKKISKDKS